jgi:hypothetical protein
VTRTRIGPGVYLLKDKHVAKEVAKRKSGVNEAVVVEVKVNLGRVADLGNRNDTIGEWQSDFDSARGTHPAGWHGLPEFEEYCVKPSQLAKAMHVHLLGDSVQLGCIVSSEPLDITIYGSATINGSIVCNTFTLGGVF